jgi:hypothetical protein
MTSNTYRFISLALAATFAGVGLAFLLTPGSVAAFVGHLSRWVPMPAGEVESGLFRALAAAYMYLVTWIAWRMFGRPDEAVWPGILAQAKLASATFSVVLILLLGATLLLVANAIVDALLGVLAIWLRRQVLRRRSLGQVAAS